MHRLLIVVIYFFIIIGFVSIDTSFSRVNYYNAMMQSDTNKINSVLLTLNKSAIESSEAFKGALLMKQAQYQKKNADKLSLFKKGRSLLEHSINTSNKLQSEKRFLRLMIQEKAPAILNYRKNISEDALFVQQHYNELDAYTKTIVVKYANQSVALKNKRFQ
jgi:uncharacterized Fe-S cluster-containing protein